MKNTFIIIDSYKNTVIIDSDTMREFAKLYKISDIKRHNTKKEVYDEIRRFLNGDTNG